MRVLLVEVAEVGNLWGCWLNFAHLWLELCVGIDHHVRLSSGWAERRICRADTVDPIF